MAVEPQRRRGKGRAPQLPPDRDEHPQATEPRPRPRIAEAPTAGREYLKPTCPHCRESRPEIVDRSPARFPFAVRCKSCGWQTAYVKLRTLAIEIWNDAPRS
jgi:hypothetical protein